MIKDTKIHFLENLISQKRLETLKNVLNNRIDTITIILESFYDSHNISAVIRTAEALGLQDIHIVENKMDFEINAGISKYSHKWVTIHKHKSAKDCVEYLKKKNFQICVSSLSLNSISLYDIEITKESKTAFILGNEHSGVSKEMLGLADIIFIIPMSGFTQSFNVSVAAALILNHSINIKRSLIEGKSTLSKQRISSLYKQWIKKSVKNSDKIISAINNS